MDGSNNVYTIGRSDHSRLHPDPARSTSPQRGRGGQRRARLGHVVSKLTQASPLMAAGSNESPGSSVRKLSLPRVRPLLNEALARWQTTGADTSALGRIDVRIADLGGTTLGLASGNTIWLDDNAAGWGWFVDRTPRNDSEFTRPGNQGEQNRMDLLTVVAHETGHRWVTNMPGRRDGRTHAGAPTAWIRGPN